MSDEIAIADPAYSSWSLRGWLMFVRFGLPVTVRTARLYSPELPGLLADFGAARTVPAARIGGAIVWDSLAIAETLAEAYPAAGLWPTDFTARATARSLAAEMHAGFAALRAACPMNLRRAYRGFEPDAAVRSDLARIEGLWTATRAAHGTSEPWLLGAYSAADACFAPVAARIASYDLPVGPEAAAYVAAHLADPAFLDWRAMATASPIVHDLYEMDLPERPWPGPAASGG
jgi:glutathione S-transferase